MDKEWKVIFYKNEYGECPVEDFISSLPENNSDKMWISIKYLEDIGINLRRPQGDYLRDGIYELRVKLSGKQTRTLYYFCFEEYIILTHTFIKNTNGVPEAEINRSLLYKQDFLNRFNKNNIGDEYVSRFRNI